MKRAISIVLTLAMLVSLVAVIPMLTGSAADYTHTLDKYNQAIEAYKYEGSVVWTALSGSGGKRTPFYWLDEDNGYEPVTVKTGTTSDVITLNGIIEDGEWGTPSVSISSADAVLFKAGSSTNLNYEYPTAENTFFTYVDNADGKAVKDGAGLAYDVYFMWDNDYLYIAAKVYDPDGHANNIHSEPANLWQGDAFQFRIDGEGPNSVVDGSGYDASVPSPGDYDKDGNAATGAFSYPWASTVKKSGQELYSEVCNVIVAYTTGKNGYTAVYDAGRRYNPHDENELDENGEVVGTYTAYTGCALSYYNNNNVKNPDWIWHDDLYTYGSGDMVYATVSPVGSGTGYDTEHFTSDYEIALPWSYVNIQSGDEIAPGLELGVALGLLNKKAGTSETGENSYLEWGNGVFPGRMSAMPQTCGGSNSMILSETSYKDHVACAHEEFNYPTCEDPYVCASCGYEKGYKAGHKYVVYEQVLPTSSKDGYSKAKCSTCGEEVERTLASSYDVVQKHFYKTDSKATLKDESTGNQFSSGYTDTWFKRNYFYNEETEKWEAETYIDADGNSQLVNKGDYLDPDGSKKYSYWGAGETKVYSSLTLDDSDLIVNPFGYAVLDFTSIDMTGTYLMINGITPSYVYKQQFYFEGVYDVDREHDEANGDINYGNAGYLDSYYFWCGGPLEMDYLVGMFKVEGEWYFAIIKGTYNISRDTITLEDFKNYAIVCNKATAEQVAEDTWHEVVFFYDKDANIASLYWDDTLVCGAYDEHFTTDRNGKNGNSYVRPFNVQYYTTDIEVGYTSLASKYVPDYFGGSEGPVEPPVEPVSYTLTVDGEIIGEYEAGKEVTITASVAEDYVFDAWTAEGVELADAAAETVTFVMPEANVTLTSVSYQIGDINKDGKINIADMYEMKTLIVEAADATPLADIDGNGKLNLVDVYGLKKRIIA